MSDPIEQQRARTRARFPFAARIIDELRAVFGPEVGMLYAEQDGRTVGKPLELAPGEFAVTADKMHINTAKCAAFRAMVAAEFGKLRRGPADPANAAYLEFFGQCMRARWDNFVPEQRGRR